MLVITMRCDRPGCDGTVEFAHARRGGSRHNLGRCDSCGARFRLHGGQVDPVERHAVTGTRGHVTVP